MREEYEATSPSSLERQIVLPSAAESAAIAPSRPPGMTNTRSRTTRGDSLMPHRVFGLPKRSSMLNCQITSPESFAILAASPIPFRTKSESPTMVGTERGPSPLSGWS